MKKSLMKKQNWITVVIGILVMYLGFALASRITTNYDGVYAFITVSTILAGLVIVVLGLAMHFESAKESDDDAPVVEKTPEQ
jgi:uncharacterized membrane protein